jgi:hypothetical protein
MNHEMKIVQFNTKSLRLHVKCTCGAWAADYRDELNHQKRDFRRHWELATNVTPKLTAPPPPATERTAPVRGHVRRKPLCLIPTYDL